MALARRRDHGAEVVSLLTGLVHDKDVRVRQTALFALEQLPVRGSPHADAIIEAAVGALDDRKPEVRLEAGRALYVFGQAQRSVTAMARMVREEEGSLRMGALGWLIMAKSVPKDLERILRKMVITEDVGERIWVRRALFQIGIPERDRAAMIDAELHSLFAAERFDATDSLIKMGKGHSAVPVLTQLAASTDKATAARAERMLFELARDQHDPP